MVKTVNLGRWSTMELWRALTREQDAYENSMVFWGEVSLENNGGFSSLRSNFSNKQLSQFEKVSLRYRSKGISLAMTFSVSNRWYVPNYKFSLASTGGEWSMITINLNQFRKHYIGKPMNEMLDQEVLKKVIRMGFITDEKKYGSFEFEVDYINSSNLYVSYSVII